MAAILAMPRHHPTRRRGLAFNVHKPGRVQVEIYAAEDVRHLDLPPGALVAPHGEYGEVVVVTLSPWGPDSGP